MLLRAQGVLHFCYSMNVSHPVPSPFHLCRSSEQDTTHVLCVADQKDIFVLLLLAASAAVLGELLHGIPPKAKLMSLSSPPQTHTLTHTHTHILPPWACRESVQYYHRSISFLCSPPASESLLWGSLSSIFTCIFIFNILLCIKSKIFSFMNQFA